MRHARLLVFLGFAASSFGGACSTSSSSSTAGAGAGSSAGNGGASSSTSGGAGSTSSQSSGAGGSEPDAGTDAASDAGVELCSSPPGNLLLHGTFEEGMDALAPHLWQVRNPAQPDACMGSGTPDQHVFLTPGAPGCGGSAVALDARGQWDCYAIQMYTDYNTIEGGATYRISATMRSQGNAVNPSGWFHLGAQWLDGNDAVFGDLKSAKPATPAENDYDWRLFFYDVVAPANAKRIVVWLTAHYPGRVDYDNVAVVKLP